MTTQTFLPALHTLQPLMARTVHDGQYALSAEKFAVGMHLDANSGRAFPLTSYKSSLFRVRQNSADYQIFKRDIYNGSFKRTVFIVALPQEVEALFRNLTQWLAAPQPGELNTTLRSQFLYGPNETRIGWWSLSGDFFITLDEKSARKLLLSVGAPRFLEAQKEVDFPSRKDLRVSSEEFPKQRPHLVGLLSLFRL